MTYQEVGNTGQSIDYSIGTGASPNRRARFADGMRLARRVGANALRDVVATHVVLKAGATVVALTASLLSPHHGGQATNNNDTSYSISDEAGYGSGEPVQYASSGNAEVPSSTNTTNSNTSRVEPGNETLPGPGTLPNNGR